ncbi:MAG: efflux RND transporter periplasmic adaptor subunit [Candidatus Pseudobacter hemicellulosilyticus]|uniref:Efflux RND transporter periplasmic adaptor subunit n=1 Tax=Candidatus Pseudobacter hemicellulosilyticus TaxID=3121375 RepID=A0AAJ5WUA2_9BACT|nr:MAG: efflux RND transporter periplasmic adaptor subunit [Pseudobacter sp.]
MQKIYRISAAMLVLFLAACGPKDQLAEKKKKLESLKAGQEAQAKEISQLEEEISKLDTTVRIEKTKLVAIQPVQPAQFTHYIDLKGRIDAQNMAYVTPRGAGGQVKALYVKQGDVVRKGQLLMKLDDVVNRQQIEQVKVQLSLAQTLYERRKNLWDQQIGTEVELLQAKNNVDNLKKQIDLLNDQLDMTNVYAEMSGVADMVNIRVGETFAAASASTLGVRIVNTGDLKVVADVPENYLGKVGVGSNLLISLPELNNDTLRARVNVAGKIIDPSTRSFYVEARIPASKNLRPNQLAIVRIQDYSTPQAITVPVSTLQSDEKGKFVMVAVKEGNKLVAKKNTVTVGELYGDKLEIRSGLQAGESLITEGFQGLYEGQPITTDVQ